MSGVREKNFVGAVCGGVLGILAAARLHPGFLPVGCLVGVIVGWCAKDAFQAVVSTFRGELGKFQHGIRLRVRLSHVRYYQTRRRIANFWYLTRNAANRVIGWITTFLAWLKAHPMNRVFVLRILAVVIFCSCNTLWIIPLVLWMIRGVFPHIGFFVFPFAMLGFIPLMFFVGLPVDFVLNNAKKITLADFYRTWEQYGRLGSARFLFKDIFDMLWFELDIVLYVASLAFWWLGLGALFAFCVVVPVFSVVTATKVLYRAITSSGYWLCLGTTICVTGTSWWLLASFIASPTGLALTALLAGLLSAAAVELLHQVLPKVFDASKTLNSVAHRPVSACLLPGLRKFSDLGNALRRVLEERIPVPSPS